MAESRLDTGYNVNSLRLIDTSKVSRSGSIVFYLQTYDKRDDVLIVTRLHQNRFRADFKNTTIGRNYVTQFESVDALMNYLDTFMIMSVIDTEGFDFMQIDIPGLPAVIIRPNRRDWEMVYNRLYDYFEAVNKSNAYWPKEFEPNDNFDN